MLRFEHVDFAYDDGASSILHDISFEVGPGKTLGIVGPPGSGKSTIANLIPRFYDVTGGRDHHRRRQDIRDVTLASLREYVGLVQQEAFLFDATVTNNVAYADPWAEDDAHRRRDQDRAAARLHRRPARRPTTRGSASAAWRSPAASASGCRSPAASCRAPAS